MKNDEKKVLMSIQDINIEFSKKKNVFSKAQSIKVIRDLSLDIHEGEIIAVVGESGCGKTTLGKAICGLYKPAKGKIMFNGKDIWDMSGKEFDEYRNGVQMVQQDSYAALNPVRTIYESLSGPLLEKKIVKNGVEARARVAELLDNRLSEDDEDILDDIGLDMNEIVRTMAEQAKSLPATENTEDL